MWIFFLVGLMLSCVEAEAPQLPPAMPRANLGENHMWWFHQMWGLDSFTVEGSPNIRILLASRLVLHAAPIFYEFVFGKKTVHSHGPFPIRSP